MSIRPTAQCRKKQRCRGLSLEELPPSSVVLSTFPCWAVGAASALRGEVPELLFRLGGELYFNGFHGA
jgi:hypothetical protein